MLYKTLCTLASSLILLEGLLLLFYTLFAKKKSTNSVLERFAIRKVCVYAVNVVPVQ